MRLLLIFSVFLNFLTLGVLNTRVYAAETVKSDNQGIVPITELTTVFANILNVITVIAGFAILIVLVMGAFRFIVAQGDPKAVSTARSQITWGFLGLFFLVAAWLIILFISTLTGFDLTKFCLSVSC